MQGLTLIVAETQTVDRWMDVWTNRRTDGNLNPARSTLSLFQTPTLIPLFFFVLKMMSAFMTAAYIQVHFRQDIFMQATNMNPEQTAPSWEQSDLGPHCLQYSYLRGSAVTQW